VLYQSGIVAEVCGQTARVEFIRSGSCGGCSSDKGCGLGPILAMGYRPRSHFLEFDTDDVGIGLKVGDTVRISIAEHQLLKFISLAYLLPLLGMFSGAWLATVAIPDASDLGAVVGALSGLFCVAGLLALTGIGKAGGYLRSDQLQSVKPAQSGAD